MNNELMQIIAIAAVVGVIIGLPWLFKLRRAFLVPEGYAGLLYERGKFVEVLRAGEHIRWGRKFSLGVSDLRKTSVLVAGQEVLSADNVGLKASLLVTYQVVDPAKAAHETQNWHGDLYNAAQIAFRAFNQIKNQTMQTKIKNSYEIKNHARGSPVSVEPLALWQPLLH